MVKGNSENNDYPISNEEVTNSETSLKLIVKLLLLR